MGNSLFFPMDSCSSVVSPIVYLGPEGALGDSPGLSEVKPWVTIPPGGRPVGAHESIRASGAHTGHKTIEIFDSQGSLCSPWAIDVHAVGVVRILGLQQRYVSWSSEPCVAEPMLRFRMDRRLTLLPFTHLSEVLPMSPDYTHDAALPLRL